MFLIQDFNAIYLRITSLILDLFYISRIYPLAPPQKFLLDSLVPIFYISYILILFLFIRNNCFILSILTIFKYNKS